MTHAKMTISSMLCWLLESALPRFAQHSEDFLRSINRQYLACDGAMTTTAKRWQANLVALLDESLLFATRGTGLKQGLTSAEVLPLSLLFVLCGAFAHVAPVGRHDRLLHLVVLAQLLVAIELQYGFLLLNSHRSDGVETVSVSSECQVPLRCPDLLPASDALGEHMSHVVCVLCETLKLWLRGGGHTSSSASIRLMVSQIQMVVAAKRALDNCVALHYSMRETRQRVFS
jgi:hypothetical protein